MHWIYLSPHFDDVVLSCGGIIHQQTRLGEQVEIWTICAGDVPKGELSVFARSLHQRWQTGDEAVSIRRQEDIAACQRLGVSYHHLEIPDCVYRVLPGGEPVIQREEDLFQPIKPGENILVEKIASHLKARLPQKAYLVSPLAAGGHVDHRLTRQSAEMVSDTSVYYADYPYSARFPNQVNALVPQNYESMRLVFEPQDLQAWVESILCYASQISTFWSTLEEMRESIQAYAVSSQHRLLWFPKGFVPRV